MLENRHIYRVKDTIVQSGAPVLREKASPVLKKELGSPGRAGRTLSTLITKMKKALDAEQYGVAIAAPQVGVSVRVFVVAGRVFKEESEESDEDSHKSDATLPDRVYINPEITRASRKKKEMSEGCLSVRGQYGTVLRHEKMTLKALDQNGKPILQHASGLLSQIFQHEVDHLNGILFTDKVEHIEAWKEHSHE